MLRKTVIVLAKTAAFTSGLTVETFADAGGRGAVVVRAADGCA